jgi:hypothetical protein
LLEGNLPFLVRGIIYGLALMIPYRLFELDKLSLLQLMLLGLICGPIIGLIDLMITKAIRGRYRAKQNRP